MAGLIIGLHPESAKAPQPGTVGSMGFGLETYEPLEQVIPTLEKRGVKVTSDIVTFEAGNAVSFEDPDGHRSYVHEFPPFMLQERDLPASNGAVHGTAHETISGGHAIVYVSNMDAAVRFYSEVLELPLDEPLRRPLGYGRGGPPHDRLASANSADAEAGHEGLDRARARR